MFRGCIGARPWQGKSSHHARRVHNSSTALFDQGKKRGDDLSEAEKVDIHHPGEVILALPGCGRQFPGNPRIVHYGPQSWKIGHFVKD